MIETEARAVQTATRGDELVGRIACSRAEAARALGIGMNGLDALIRAGHLRATRVGCRRGRVLVSVASIRALLDG